jgi:hypothetical protein
VTSEEDDRDERPRRSWSEIDKLRDKPRSRRDERGPRGPAADARARAAAREYLGKMDRHLFAKGTKGGAAGARLADAVREALGTPALDDACRAYLAAIGPPKEAALVAAFLDAGDRAVQLAAVGALLPEAGAGRVALTTGLRAQLRTLAFGDDDELAEAAEAALAAG